MPVEVSVDGGEKEIRIAYQVNPEVGEFVQKLSD